MVPPPPPPCPPGSGERPPAPPPGFVPGGSSRAPGGRPQPRPAGDRCWRCGHLPDPGQPQRPCPRCANEAAPPPMPPRLPSFPSGVGATLRGLRFVGRHPGLWSWIVAPLVLNVLVTATMIWAGITWLDVLTPDLSAAWPVWIDWLRVAVDWILAPILGVLVVLVALVLAVMLQGVFNAPFYDLLSEKTENAHFGIPDPGRPLVKLLPDSLRAMKAALYLLARQVLVMSALFVLSFTAIGAPLLVFAGAFYSGAALLDITLSRKRYKGRTRAAWGRRHWDLLAGLGVPVNLFPVLAPFGVVGATLVFLDHPEKH